MDIKNILTKAISIGASDIHLKTGVGPIVRVHGKLKPLDPEIKRLTSEQIKDLAYSIMNPKQILMIENQREVDMGFGISGVGRFRANVFRQRGSIQVVIRTILDRVPKVTDLNLPPVVEKIALLERGLVLVTGATGSGKSSTMAAIVDYINQNRTKHIITIEDPIEFLMRDRRSLITQRELGQDTESFALAMRSAMRQDPDVIMIGEMRDKETTEIALTAAETGHLVISTLHTGDAQESINRILAFFDNTHHQQIRLQLALVLKAVISQRLARKADGSGLIPAVEVMLVNQRIRDMLVNATKSRDLIAAIEEGYITYGMQSFDQSLLDLLTKKMITLEEALELSTRPEDLRLRYAGIKGSGGKKWDNFDNKDGVDNSAWVRIEKLDIEKVDRGPTGPIVDLPLHDDHKVKNKK